MKKARYEILTRNTRNGTPKINLVFVICCCKYACVRQNTRKIRESKIRDFFVEISRADYAVKTNDLRQIRDFWSKIRDFFSRPMRTVRARCAHRVRTCAV